MTFDKFTIKAQEVVQEAVNIASAQGQQSIEPVHLLKGILLKGKDVAGFIFRKLGVNAVQVENITDREIAGRPKVQGGQPYLNNEPTKCCKQPWRRPGNGAMISFPSNPS